MSKLTTKFYVQQKKQGNGKNRIIYNLTKDNACAEWNEMNRRLAGQSFPSRVLKEKMENGFVTAPFWTRTLKVISYKSCIELFLWKSILMMVCHIFMGKISRKLEPLYIVTSAIKIWGTSNLENCTFLDQNIEYLIVFCTRVGLL